MRVYTVHLRPAGGPPDRDAVLVEERFCWPAALLPVLWALWHGMWAVLLLLLALAVALVAAGALLGLSDPGFAVVAFGCLLLLGQHGNDLRRWTLGRRGYRLEGVVMASGLAEAERRLFEGRPELFRTAAPAAPAPTRVPTTVPARARPLARWDGGRGYGVGWPTPGTGGQAGGQG